MNTELRADTHMVFADGEHEKFYYEKMEQVRYQDCYHKALIYILGISEDTRTHFDQIYDIKAGYIKPECLQEGWQTSGSVNVVRLALNLYTDGVPSVDDYKHKDEQIDECRRYSVSDIFCCGYAMYFFEGIRLRYPEYCCRQKSMEEILTGMEDRKSAEGEGLSPEKEKGTEQEQPVLPEKKVFPRGENVMRLKDLEGIVLDEVQLYCDGERKGEYVNIGKSCALYDMPKNLLELEVYIINSMGNTLEIMVDKRALEKEKSREQEQPVIFERKAFPKGRNVMKLKDLDKVVMEKVQLYCDGERKGEHVNIGKLCALDDMPENLLELEAYIINLIGDKIGIKVDKRALEKEKSREQEQPVIPERKAFPKTKKTR